MRTQPKSSRFSRAALSPDSLARAQRLDGARRGDVVAPVEEAGVELHRLGLAGVVQLLAQPIADLHQDGGGVQRAVHAAVQAEDGGELGQIALHRALHLRILELDRQARAVGSGGVVDLAEGGGGRGPDLRP